MGVFDKLKKKQESAGVLPNSILLSETVFDAELFKKAFFEEWGITIPADYAEKNGGELDMVVTEIDNMRVAVCLLPAPVPGAVENAKTNYRWPEAVSVTESHKAHILVAVLPLGKQSLFEIATLQTKLCVTCLKLPYALAINAAGTVFAPDFYTELAKLFIEKGSFPILCHVFFGLYSSDDGKTFSGYTYGLSNLGKKDIEVLNSSREADEIYDFLVDIALYVIESDVVLKDGETIGFSAEQKLPITESAGVALDGKTLKIQFD